MTSRRDALQSMLFGAGAVGLRALATGLPVSLLAHPRQALADEHSGMCGNTANAQFVIFNTSADGDPINASVPGTYDDPLIVHSADPTMAPTTLTIRAQKYTAAAPWATLPQNVLDRTCFWHLMTNTPVHPKEQDVLKLMHATRADEMLPSLLAQQLAPCLGTIQAQPLNVGASSPSEGLTSRGHVLPIIPALALKSMIANPEGPLSKLQPLRDQTINQLYDLYKNGASPAGRAYIDSLVSSQQQVRSISQNLLNQLSSIKDNSPDSQVLAAVTLIQMKVTPVVVIHIPFGADNHRDVALQAETTQTVTGVATLASLMARLASAGLTDRVTFMSLNVFGRTLGPGTTDGRDHNGNHQVSITIGRPFLGGVVGGVAPVANSGVAAGSDYGALPIDSKTGRASPSGDISAVESLASFGQTVLAGVGVDPASVSAAVASGKVISGALA
jgi:hypothetical protein